MTERVWMRRNHGGGVPQEFDATPSVIVPLMVAGWSQCDPPEPAEEVTENVDD